MTPANIINRVQSDGVSLSLSATGTIKAKGEAATVSRWLTAITEHKTAIIALLKGPCPQDVDMRDDFNGLTVVELADPFPDDRRTCNQCANLVAQRCQAAKRGEIMASWHYEPISDLLQRCGAYAPKREDSDRRPGYERWIGLTQKGRK